MVRGQWASLARMPGLHPYSISKDILRFLMTTESHLSRWIVDAIIIAYESSDLPSPLGVKAHSTRGLAASKSFLTGVPIQDICDAAGWSTPLTFVRFYDLDLQATPGSSVLLP